MVMAFFSSMIQLGLFIYTHCYNWVRSGQVSNSINRRFNLNWQINHHDVSIAPLVIHCSDLIEILQNNATCVKLRLSFMQLVYQSTTEKIRLFCSKIKESTDRQTDSMFVDTNSLSVFMTFTVGSALIDFIDFGLFMYSTSLHYSLYHASICAVAIYAVFYYSDDPDQCMGKDRVQLYARMVEPRTLVQR